MTTVEEQKKLVAVLCHRFRSILWAPVSQMQRETSHDPLARGGVWISRMSSKAPEDTGVRTTLYCVCERLKAPDQYFAPPLEVPLKDVGVEFIGHRSCVGDKAKEPDIAKRHKLKARESKCKNDIMISHIHGGGL